MHLIRRWLVYRRLLDELGDAQRAAPGGMRVCRCAVRDFAWHCAGVEVERANRVHRPAVDGP
jgi:hypothetical protein